MDEGMKGRFFLKTFRDFFCEDPFGMYLVGCVLSFYLFGWLVFICEFLRFIDFQLNDSMASNGASSSTTL